MDAFWSVTMYDQEGFQIANPIDRFAIGDRDALQFGPDGSVDILVQHASPGPDKESNWLPAPTGPFSLCMRLYAPRPEAPEGRWNPPPLRRLPQIPKPVPAPQHQGSTRRTRLTPGRG